jgi:hypothetical protein
VSVASILDWRSGRQATSHEVYLSADEAAVTDGTALVGTVAESPIRAERSGPGRDVLLESRRGQRR